MGIIKASESPFIKEEWFKTGIMPLDYAIGKGLPKGRIVEIVGAKSSGKTTVVLEIIKEAQKQGMVCAYADAEQALDYNYAKSIGVDLDKLLLIQGEVGEDYLDEIVALLEDKGADLIVLDSIDALLPRAMAEAVSEQQFIGAKARMLSKFLPKIVLPLRQNKAIFLVVNQQRMDIMTGRLTSSGGRALEYYKSVMIKLAPVSRLQQGAGVVGIKVKGVVEKNKVGAPFKQFEFSILFGKGVSAEMGLIDALLEEGILQKNGAWFLYNGEKLAYGLAKLREKLEKEPELKAKLEYELQNM